MRVVLSAHGSRADVGPPVALAVRSRGLGTEARVCAPPDKEFAEPSAGARAWSVAGTIRTGGATVTATPPLDAVSRERPPAPA
ncbi:hypothetical protein AB0F88_26235 [Streptosporangium sp. NPDC023963]|uniref:hypothetical protein n=1 Tax=Streptosporangium sp. NPDC023963 TaxID=3155608 RepID=UPI0034164589